MMNINNPMNDVPGREQQTPPTDEPDQSSVQGLMATAQQGNGASIAQAGISTDNPYRVVVWIKDVSAALKQLWDALLHLIARAFTADPSPDPSRPVDATDRARIDSLNRLSPDAMLNLTASELSDIPNEAAHLLSIDLLWGLSDAVQDALGFGELNAHSREEIGRLQASDLNTLRPIAIRGLWCDVLNFISDEALNGLSAEVINGLSLESLILIDPNILNKLSPAALAGLEPRVLNSLPLDPLPMLRDEVKQHLKVKAVRWTQTLSLADVITPAIRGNIRNGERLFWVKL